MAFNARTDRNPVDRSRRPAAGARRRIARAARRRRAGGRDRTAKVDRQPADRLAGARRPAAARRPPRRPAARARCCCGSRSAASPATTSWRWPSPSCGTSPPSRARRSTSRSPARRAPRRSPRSRPATCSARAAGSDGAACRCTPARSARSSSRSAPCTCRRGELRRSRRARSPTARALEADLGRARARGFVTAVDELEDGLAAVAAPVRDVFGDDGRRAAISGPDAPDAGGADRGPRPSLRRAGDGSRREARQATCDGRSGMTHDDILKGLYEETLVGNAPAVRELTDDGLADGHVARVDALRRADPVARGGRRPLRARRLLRARDADRGPRHAGRARHPAPAAGRDRRASRSARS